MTYLVIKVNHQGAGNERQNGVFMPDYLNYLSIKEVASYLGLSDKWVYLHQKEIPGYLKVAGKTLYDKEVLIKELKKRSSGSHK